MIILSILFLFFLLPSLMKTQDEKYKTQRQKEEFQRVIREEAKRGNRWR